MELTPEQIVDQIKQLMPVMATFQDEKGNLIQGNPIEWLKNVIREYGDQQRQQGRIEGLREYRNNYCDDVKNKENGTNKRT